MKQAQESLLIMRTSALGDVAMTIPAVYSLARSYPNVRISMLTAPKCAELFINRPPNLSLILFKQEHRGAIGFFRLWKRIRQERFDSVADFHNVLRSWLLDICFICQGKRVSMLDKRRCERRIFLWGKGGADLHPFSLRYFDVLRRLGYRVTPDFVSLFPDAPCLPIEKQPGDTWIGIAPFARYPNKTYPTDKMEEVVHRLCNRPRTRIFLFGGGKEEKKALDGWTKRDAVYSCCEHFSMKEELCLMANMDVMLTMDSSNMHLASLVNTRVVSLWGSTVPACGFLGWRQRQEDALIANLTCQPCSISGNKRCRYGSFKCLTSITPEEIYDKIIRTL